jgi:hypothetical protein
MVGLLSTSNLLIQPLLQAVQTLLTLRFCTLWNHTGGDFPTTRRISSWILIFCRIQSAIVCSRLSAEFRQNLHFRTSKG